MCYVSKTPNRELGNASLLTEQSSSFRILELLLLLYFRVLHKTLLDVHQTAPPICSPLGVWLLNLVYLGELSPHLGLQCHMPPG